MSYTLEWDELPEPAAAARARHEECFHELCPHTPSCYPAYATLAEPFRVYFNSAGMGVCRENMRRVGMIFHAEHRAFPPWPFADDEDWETAEPSRREAYRVAERAAAAQAVPGMVGIPDFKLMSNGPWVVTAREVRQALELHDAAPEAVRGELAADEVWRLWLDWLRETVERGGFRVD